MLERRLRQLHVDLHRIRRLRRLRRNPARETLAFQLEALGIITAAESRIRQCRTLQQVEHARLAAASGVRLSKEEARAAKRIVEGLTSRIVDARWTIDTARAVVDGLAFTFLPKWDIKPIAVKEPSGFISGKRGLLLERRVLRMISNKGFVALLNDLTHCLRVGDVTVSDDPPRILEVKSGHGRTARDLRQQEHAQAVGKFLRDDVIHNWKGSDVTVVRSTLTVPERHHRRLIPRMISEATNEGFAIRRPETGIIYCATTSEQLGPAVRTAMSNCSEKTLAVPLLRAHMENYWFPLSLSIADSEAWWLVATGTVAVIVFLDVARIAELFAQRHIEAIWEDEDRPNVGPGWALSSPNAAMSPFHISSQFFGRVAAEFLSVRWFVEEMAARLERGPTVPNAVEESTGAK